MLPLQYQTTEKPSKKHLCYISPNENSPKEPSDQVRCKFELKLA